MVLLMSLSLETQASRQLQVRFGGKGSSAQRCGSPRGIALSGFQCPELTSLAINASARLYPTRWWMGCPLCCLFVLVRITFKRKLSKEDVVLHLLHNRTLKSVGLHKIPSGTVQV